jgi:hypothetical protein
MNRPTPKASSSLESDVIVLEGKAQSADAVRSSGSPDAEAEEIDSIVADALSRDGGVGAIYLLF